MKIIRTSSTICRVIVQNVSKAMGKSCLLSINARREASFSFLIHSPHCWMMHTEKIYLSETHSSDALWIWRRQSKFSFVPFCVNMGSLYLKSVLLLSRRTAEVQSWQVAPLQPRRFMWFKSLEIRFPRIFRAENTNCCFPWLKTSFQLFFLLKM